jgi:hypothetical protein
MPKYDIILVKRKFKTIRASSKDIARKRAEAMEKNGWMIDGVEDNAMLVIVDED